MRKQKLLEEISYKNKIIEDLNRDFNQYHEDQKKYKIEAEKNKITIDKLNNKITDLIITIDKSNNKITDLINTINSQQAVIEFLVNQKFSSEEIEFAAIKKYRSWECLYLNGNKIDMDRCTDLNICWTPNQPVTVSAEQV